MLVFDQLKRKDPQLRMVALVVLSGLTVLLAGLWWVQVVSTRDYQESLETQCFRTVRIPAVRGKILDRQGNVLAENRPSASGAICEGSALSKEVDWTMFTCNNGRRTCASKICWIGC